MGLTWERSSNVVVLEGGGGVDYVEGVIVCSVEGEFERPSGSRKQIFKKSSLFVICPIA